MRALLKERQELISILHASVEMTKMKMDSISVAKQFQTPLHPSVEEVLRFGNRQSKHNTNKEEEEEMRSIAAAREGLWKGHGGRARGRIQHL